MYLKLILRKIYIGIILNCKLEFKEGLDTIFEITI